jgi:protein O-GlcNAc transferase
MEIYALRPAPVQVRYLGLAGTTGADFFDYIITDRIVTPEEHAQYYSENFVYMPHCYQVNDHTQEISNKDWKKTDYGLPEGSFVFCSFNQGYKIEPVMFNTWMKILRQVTESVLWLQGTSETAKKNLRMEAEARGVKSDRLIFAEKLPKCEHLARLRFADVALDTRIVSGAATTSDALWVSIPVVTLLGSNFASRMSSSILTAIGLSELVVHSIEEYEALAVRLAHNPGELQTIRHKLTKNLSTEPLFDTPRFAKNLEKAYKEMWEIFMIGESPRQIEVVES